MKQCEYEQQIKYLKKDVSAIDKMLRKKSKNGSLLEWAYIIHDKDDGVEPHIHVMMKFQSSQTADNIAKWFDDEPNRINIKQSRWENKLSYLCHRTRGDYDKYQYNPDEVIANFDYPALLDTITEGVKISELDAILRRIDIGEIREFNLFDSVTIEQYTKYERKIKSALEYARGKIMNDKNRDIKVVAMSGPTGTGKTTYAKQLCAIMNKSYCVSSSSNDPFQDYKGEDVMILDDLRDSTFKYADLLKILDNHTKSTSWSRYNNKAFIGDMIIITSCEPIEKWYENGKTEEDRKQLRRRVTEQLYFDKKSIRDTVYNPLTDTYDYVGEVPNMVTATYKETTKALFTMLESINANIEPSIKEKLLEKAENEDKKGILPFEQMTIYDGASIIPLEDDYDDADDMELPF